MTIIGRGLAHQLSCQARLQFAPEGLRAELAMPTGAIMSADGGPPS